MKHAIAALFLLFASSANALVLNGGIRDQLGEGKFILLDPAERFAVGADTFDTDHLYAFNEDQNIVLEHSIRVDIGGVGGVIEAGRTVASTERS